MALRDFPHLIIHVGDTADLPATPHSKQVGFWDREAETLYLSNANREWVESGGGGSAAIIAVSFTQASGTLALFTPDGNIVITQVVVEVASSDGLGTPTIVIGTAGSPNRYVVSSEVDLTQTGEYNLMMTEETDGNAVQAVITAGGGTFAGVIYVSYALVETLPAYTKITNHVLPRLTRTLSSYFRVGAFRLKDSAGEMQIRNAADSADANLKAAQVNITGALDHDGATVGFRGVAPVAMPSSTADIKDSLQAVGLLHAADIATPLNLNGGALTASIGTFTSTLSHTGASVGFRNATPLGMPSATADIKDSLQAVGLLNATNSATPLNLDGGTIRAGEVNSTGIRISNSAGTLRYIYFETGINLRFDMRVDNASESGSNAGSNFYLNAYNDAGALLGEVYRVPRANQEFQTQKLIVLSDTVVARPYGTTNTLWGVKFSGHNFPVDGYNSRTDYWHIGAYYDGVSTHYRMQRSGDTVPSFMIDSDGVTTTVLRRIVIQDTSNIAELRLVAADSSEAYIKVGQGRLGLANSYLDLIGDNIYTTYGTRLQRASGSTGETRLYHRGTGVLRIRAEDAGTISLDTNATARLSIASGGLVTLSNGLTVNGAKSTLAAPAAGYASLNLPSGTAPSSPADGDLWIDTGDNSLEMYFKQKKIIQGLIWQHWETLTFTGTALSIVGAHSPSAANGWGVLKFPANTMVVGKSLTIVIHGVAPSGGDVTARLRVAIHNNTTAASLESIGFDQSGSTSSLQLQFYVEYTLVVVSISGTTATIKITGTGVGWYFPGRTGSSSTFTHDITNDLNLDVRAALNPYVSGTGSIYHCYAVG